MRTDNPRKYASHRYIDPDLTTREFLALDFVCVRTFGWQAIQLLAPANELAHHPRSQDVSDLREVWNVSALRSANMEELWSILPG